MRCTQAPVENFRRERKPKKKKKERPRERKMRGSECVNCEAVCELKVVMLFMFVSLLLLFLLFNTTVPLTREFCVNQTSLTIIHVAILHSLSRVEALKLVAADRGRFTWHVKKAGNGQNGQRL